jgi:hypothetical protein
MDNCLIFQKLTNQEQVILSALDHITKEETKETKESDEDEDENLDSDSDSDSD